MILYLVAPIKSTRILLKPINTFCKVAGRKITIKISVIFYIIIMNKNEKKSRK